MPYDIAFTADGTMVALAVEQGVRLYSWDDVRRARGSLPQPLASAATALVQQETGWHQHTYAVIHDLRRSLILFSGFDGHVHGLHTGTGRATVVFAVPGTPPIVDLAIGGDGRSLALAAYPGMLDRGARRPPPVWQVWNLDVLLE